MKFIAWRVIEGLDEVADSNFFKLKDAEKLGFEIVFMWTYTNKANDNELLSDMVHGLRKQANDRGIPIDGAVMAKDSISLSDKLGRTDKFFRHSIAYKFEDDKYETELEDIEWTVGRTGIITPTAIFKTVKIDGTDVSRASMHNLSVMKQLSGGNVYYKGMKLVIYKANQIIPQVKEAVYVFEDEINSEVLPLPKVCPVCGGEVVVKSTGNSDVPMCTNSNCAAKKVAQFTHFVSRKCMNIDGLSDFINVFDIIISVINIHKYFITFAYIINSIFAYIAELPNRTVNFTIAHIFINDNIIFEGTCWVRYIIG